MHKFDQCKKSMHGETPSESKSQKLRFSRLLTVDSLQCSGSLNLHEEGSRSSQLLEKCLCLLYVSLSLLYMSLSVPLSVSMSLFCDIQEAQKKPCLRLAKRLEPFYWPLAASQLKELFTQVLQNCSKLLQTWCEVYVR